MRERRISAKSSGISFRITPACAGTTHLSFVAVPVCKDHPRLCGNDQIKRSFTRRMQGSPPLVRERLSPLPSLLLVFGITPACAGTTVCFSSKSPSIWDHPRLCGNDVISPPDLSTLPGSPPLVRERLHVVGFFADCFRITPACAGTTRIQLHNSIRHWDHPRLCGNDVIVLSISLMELGSPPLVRERHLDRARGCGCGGITPACAGTTRF